MHPTHKESILTTKKMTIAVDTRNQRTDISVSCRQNHLRQHTMACHTALTTFSWEVAVIAVHNHNNNNLKSKY